MSKTGGYEKFSDPEKPDDSQYSEENTKRRTKHFHAEKADTNNRSSDTNIKGKPISTTAPEWSQRQLDDARQSGHFPLLSGDQRAQQLMRDRTSETDAGDKTKPHSSDQQQTKEEEERYWEAKYRISIQKVQ